MKKKTILLVLALALIMGCVQQGANPAAETTEEASKVKVTFTVTGYSGKIIGKEAYAEKGSNAFEIMKENMNVDYTEYSFGPLVNAIEGEKPEGDDYWALYVNGQYAEKGIADYVLNEDMEIEWKIEKNPYLK